MGTSSQIAHELSVVKPVLWGTTPKNREQREFVHPAPRATTSRFLVKMFASPAREERSLVRMACVLALHAHWASMQKGLE